LKKKSSKLPWQMGIIDTVSSRDNFVDLDQSRSAFVVPVSVSGLIVSQAAHPRPRADGKAVSYSVRISVYTAKAEI
jgi:hypothetical protein